MAIRVETRAELPPGTHNGIIIAAEETTKIFDPSKGPEAVVEVTIQPGGAPKGSRYVTKSVTYPPVLNGLSNLSLLLERLNLTPEDGTDWEATSLNGVEVTFNATKPPGGRFCNIDPKSVKAAE